MILAWLLAAALTPSSWIDTKNQLAASLDEQITAYKSVRPIIEQRFGSDQAIDLGVRLMDDRESLDYDLPPDLSREAWIDLMAPVVHADIDAIARASRQDATPTLPTRAGLHEGFVKSPSDGLWEPIAVYVPAKHAPHPPLAIVLHGRPQTETELLGMPYLRDLADRTGTILVAPWGRGSYDYEGVASSDVDALVPIAQRTYDSNPRALYLVGYSMGGFSVFKIGTKRTWTAVMCIAGSLLNSEVHSVRFAWRDTPVYIVNGVNDTSIPAIYGMESAVFLDSLGIPTSFYQSPTGTHALRTLGPQLLSAWNDMHAGTVRADSIPRTMHIAGMMAPPKASSLHDTLKP